MSTILWIVMLLAAIAWMEYIVYKGLFVHGKRWAYNKEDGFSGYVGNNIAGIPPVILICISLWKLTSWGDSVVYIVIGLIALSTAVMFPIAWFSKKHKDYKGE